MRHLTRRSAVAVVAAAMLTGAATVAAPSASAVTPGAAASASENAFSSAQAACRFDYTVHDFPGGFAALLTVTNVGPHPVNGWWVEFDLAPGAVIETTYRGIFLTRSGHIQVNAPAWLPNLAPGEYASVGFNGRNANTTGVTISNVTLNDVPCTT